MSAPSTADRIDRGLSGALADRVLSAHPVPIADAVLALLGAESAFEERDRVVEVFRAELRLIAAMVMAARLQYGPGPEGEAQQVPELLRTLRARGLTDGQWVGLVREMLRPWARAADAHPLSDLVRLVHARKSELAKLWDELLVMRKSETVAHGATGTRDALEDILDKRVPQLARSLELIDPLWTALRLVVPREGDGTEHRAALMMGATPSTGRFRWMKIVSDRPLQVGEAILVDAEGRAKLSLHPVALARRATAPGAEELFLLDGSAKRAAVYVAFPSMAEHREATAWGTLDQILAEDEVIEEAAMLPRGDTPHPGSRSERPYRGLSSFGPEDAGLFFGREDQAESLANLIRRHGFITVTGRSGSGKTSLLRAGVLPMLRDTLTAFVRPGAHPLASLAASVADATAIDRAEIEPLVRDPPALRSRVDVAARERSSLFVLVVDQAEEMLTLVDDDAEREAFARALVALGHADGATRVVLSLREDFFGRLATIKGLVGVFSQHVEIVTTPDRDACFRILVGPARAFGYAFEDEELVTSIVDAVQGTSAALALISFTADRLWDARDRKWKRLTGAAYRALGGASGALASHASGVIDTLSASEAAACRSIFLRLVTGERTRAVVARSELIEAAREAGETERVLDRLVGARLVTASEDADGNSTVEIVHEALIEHWDQLTRWLSEDVEAQRLTHAIRQAAREWDARSRPRGLLWRGELLDELVRFDARAHEPLTALERAFVDACRRDATLQRRWRNGLVAAAFAALAGFAAFMFFQWRAAESARQQTEQQRQETAMEKLRAEVRGLVAEARAREGKGLSDDAHALLRAAVMLEHELGVTEETTESRELLRLHAAGAGAIVLTGPERAIRQVAASAEHQLVFSAGDDDLLVFDMRTAAVSARLPFAGWEVSAMVVSPDQRFLAVAAAAPRDGRKAVLRLYALPGLGLVQEQEAPARGVSKVAFSPDSAALLSRFWDGATTVLSTQDLGKREIDWALEGSVRDLAITRGGTVAVCTDHGSVVISAAGERVELPEREGGFRAVALASGLVARGMPDGTIDLHDVRTGEPRGTVSIGQKGVRSLEALSDGRIIAEAEDGVVHLVTIEGKGAPNAVRILGDTMGMISSGPHLAYVRGENLQGSVVAGTTAAVYDLATGTQRVVRGGHLGEIIAVTLLGDRLVTAGWDRTLRVWPERPYPVRRAIIGPPSHGGKFVAYSTTGHRVAVASTSRIATSVRVLSTEPSTTEPSTTELSATAVLHEALLGGGLADMAIDGKAERLVLAFEADGVRIVEVASAATSATLDLGGAQPVCVAARDDLARIAVGDAEGSVHLFDKAARHAVYPLHEGAVSQVRLSPDGELILSAGADKLIRVSRWRDGSERFSRKTPGMMPKMTFSPDGRLLGIGDDGEVTIYAVEGMQPLLSRSTKGDSTTAIAFAPDSRLFAAASTTIGEEGAWVVDLDTLAVKPLALRERVVDLDFSPDGTRLLAAESDGNVAVWDGAADPPVRYPAVSGAVYRARFLGVGDEATAVGYAPGMPIFDTHRVERHALLARSGAVTNLRVCRSTLDVVPVPEPVADEVWAPEEACVP